MGPLHCWSRPTDQKVMRVTRELESAYVLTADALLNVNVSGSRALLLAEPRDDQLDRRRRHAPPAHV